MCSRAVTDAVIELTVLLRVPRWVAYTCARYNQTAQQEVRLTDRVASAWPVEDLQDPRREKGSDTVSVTEDSMISTFMTISGKSRLVI